MVALPTLRPSAFVQGTLVNTTAVGNVNDGSDATFIESQSGNGVDGQWVYEIDNVPADLSAVDGNQVTVTLRCALSATGDDTWRIRPTLFNGANVTVSNIPTYVDLANSTTVQQFQFVLTHTGTNNKATWDAVRLVIDYQNVKNMAADGNVIRVMDAWADGTYTAVVDLTAVSNLVSAPASVFTPGASVGAALVDLALLTAPTTTYAPTVTVGPVSTDVPLLAAPAALLSPAVLPGEITAGVDLLAAPETLYSPAALVGDVSALAPFLTNAASVHSPGVAVGGVTVEALLLASPATVFSPGGLQIIVFTATLASSATVLAPANVMLAVDETVVMPHIYV